MLGCITLEDGTPPKSPKSQMLALCLAPTQDPASPFQRIETDVVHYINAENVPRTKRRTIYLQKSHSYQSLCLISLRYHYFWIRVADSQGQRRRSSSLQAYPLEYGPTATRSNLSENFGVPPILGFRLSWTNGVSFDVIIRIIDNTFRGDIIVATTVEIPSAKQSLRSVVESFTTNFDREDTPQDVNFKQRPAVSDKIIQEIAALGVVTENQKVK